MNTKTLTTVLLTLLSIAGYTQFDIQNIYGNWEIDFEASKVLMTTDQLTRFNDLSVEEQSQAKSQLEDQEFIFNSNAGFTALYNGNSQSGVWSLNGDSLVIDFTNGSTVSHTILSANESNIEIRIIHDATSQALFHKLSLTRKEQ